MKEFLLNRSIWIGLIIWCLLAASFNFWQLHADGVYSTASMINMLFPGALLGLRSCIVLVDMTKR